MLQINKNSSFSASFLDGSLMETKNTHLATQKQWQNRPSKQRTVGYHLTLIMFFSTDMDHFWLLKTQK